MALNMLTDWRRAQEDDGKRKVQHNLRSQSWQKPNDGWVKVNVDATCNQRDAIVGLRCVIRDEDGQFLRARSSSVTRTMQPREAEALSMKEAFSWTQQWRVSKCVFESDAQNLVDAINGHGGRSYFDTIVDDCKELLKHFTEVLVVYVPRSVNTDTHL
ncbi:uncharacterized protein LOC141719726 [Apium graveolens]|uniref:uncharacterized protein LOC141719726 n=1 Tax=Apium graveolens TaxID=4045 RepID=UPI003D78FE46